MGWWIMRFLPLARLVHSPTSLLCFQAASLCLFILCINSVVFCCNLFCLLNGNIIRTWTGAWTVVCWARKNSLPLPCRVTEKGIYWLKLLYSDDVKCENVATNLWITSYNQICNIFIKFKNTAERVIRYNGMHQERELTEGLKARVSKSQW